MPSVRTSPRLAPTVLLLVVAVSVTASCDIRSDPTHVADPEPPTGLSVTARDYLQDLVGIMSINSMNRFEIDWQAFQDSVLAAADDARTISDTYPAIRVALRLLGDGHSQYRTPEGETFWESTRSCTAPAVPSVPQLPTSVGYVRVDAFGGSGATAVQFATALQDSIRAQDRADLAGWIVDLRGNGGGNMWPMVAGVGPILGEGVLGHFVDPLGETRTWEYRDGAARLDGNPLTTVDDPHQPVVDTPRVAVLTDNRVASAGEAVAIAFVAREGARSFGMPTCGLSTANSAFPLSDGAVLVLTVSRMADRTGAVFGDEVPPDEIVADPADMVTRAAEWLEGG